MKTPEEINAKVAELDRFHQQFWEDLGDDWDVRSRVAVVEKLARGALFVVKQFRADVLKLGN